MKRLVFSILLSLLLVGGARAQNKRLLSLQLSLQQIELGYQHQLFSDNLWGEVHAGIGNQDINSQLDDFLSGMRLGGNILSTPNNKVALTGGVGIYFPTNSYYKATTLFFEGGARYSRFIGKLKQHCLFVGAYYRYGKRDYKQTYSSEMLNVSTVGTFTMAPLNLSLGYGFRF
jgi:hypothetical protein